MQAEHSDSKMTTIEALKTKRTGPMPTGRKWKGMPVPFFANDPKPNQLYAPLAEYARR